MKQCKGCKKQKKADNCIQCMLEQKKRAENAEAVIEKIRRIVKKTPFRSLSTVLNEFFE